jgi:hypothetical protein
MLRFASRDEYNLLCNTPNLQHTNGDPSMQFQNPLRFLRHLALLATAITIFTIASNSAVQAEDKETKFYDPVEMKLEGWTLAVDPALLKEENKATKDLAFEALANHLQRIKYILPKDKFEVLQTLPIWIELDNPALGNMQYHPGRGSLLGNNHDPRLVKHVHIPHAKSLFARGTWAKHPYVILHELAHSYHDQKLSFDNKDIIAAFDKAKDEGIYDKVLLYTGQKVRHYALSNHKEYFAESTEAYLGVNDFYPFVRAELKEHDPRMYELQKQIWGPVR